MSCLEAANQVAVSLSHTYFTHMLYRHAAAPGSLRVAPSVRRARVGLNRVAAQGVALLLVALDVALARLVPAGYRSDLRLSCHVMS